MATTESPGYHLRRCRVAAGLSLRALASEVGVSHVFIWGIENGKRRVPEGLAPRLAACIPGISEETLLADRRQEPRVTQRHLDLMRHATGYSAHCTRNYYVAPVDERPDDHRLWAELVGMGLADEGEPPDSLRAGENVGRVFHVTAAGFRMTYGVERVQEGT